MGKKVTDTNPESELLCVNAFCDALGVKESTCRKWILHRRIAIVKVGARLVRIPRSELKRIIQQGYRPAEIVVGGQR